MGAIRATAVVILILLSAAMPAAECVTGARVISTGANVPNLVAGPVAWSGNVLAVAMTQEDAPNLGWVAVYGENIDTVAEDRFLVNDVRSLSALEWSGMEFGLFYRTTAQGLNLQRLTNLGVPIGAPVAITPSRNVSSGDRIEVRWSAAHHAYVVVRFVSQSSARGLYITMIEENGTQRSDRPVFVDVAVQSRVALAVTEAGAIGVFFTTSNDLLGLAIVRGSTDPPIVRELISGGAGDLVAAARGDQFVVARSVLSADRTVLRWLVVNTAHDVTKADAFLVDGSGLDVHPRSLIVGDGELALAYIDSPFRESTLDDTYRLRRFTFTGELVSDTAYAPRDFNATRAVSSFPHVWTGTSYITAAVREASGRSSSYLVRFCPLRVEILAPRVVLVGETVTFTPLASGGDPGYSYAWKFSHQARVESGTVTTVERTFTETGTYTVTLTATDRSGVSTTTTFTFEVVRPRRRVVRP